MARTRVRRGKVAILLGVGVVAVLAGPIGRVMHPEASMRPVANREYVVRPGDTLWSIAAEGAAGADPRPRVDAIREANGVNPEDLVPGQTLLLPAP